MLKNLHSRISLGKDWYHTYKKEIKLNSNIPVKNKLLYQELEQACKKQGGILTYAEYLAIDQFGKNGFYTTNKLHGKTDIEKRWGDALANYCQESGNDTIIEFGCGAGELGVATAKAYKKQTKNRLKWIGIEIDTNIHQKIFDNFASANMQDSVKKIVTTINELPTIHNALIVFPYSLDNIPPQIFLNTKTVDLYPDALLGITLGNGMITEIIIPQDILRQKKIELKNGFFTQHNYTTNISSWKIRKGQRAYISIEAFTTLYSCVKKFGDGTKMILIDEFRRTPWFFTIENLGTPKSLYEKNLICNERTRYYRESGKHNLYYALYTDSMFQFLNTIGFRSIEYDIEQKKAAHLCKRPWIALRRNYTTLAFIAKDLVKKDLDSIPISFTPQRIM